MDWPESWVGYLILFIGTAVMVGLNVWYWKRDPNWRWYREGLVSLGIVAVLFAILLPVMTPRPGWYVRNDILAITFSPDGRLLAFQTRGGEVVLQDSGTGKDVWRFRLTAVPRAWPRPAYASEIARVDYRHSVLFSPDGRLLAAGRASGRVRVWNTATGDLVREMDAEEPAQPLAFTPDGKRLLVGDYIGHVNTWEVKGFGKVIQSLTVAPVNAGPADMAFNPAGLLTVITATEIQQWDPNGWRKARVHPWKAPGGNGIVAPYARAPGAFSPDGRRLALRTKDNVHGGETAEFTIWDTVAWKPIHRIVIPFNADRTAPPVKTDPIALSPDGRQMAAVGESAITMLDVATGRKVGTLPALDFTASCLAFSPDGTRLAVAGADNRTALLSVTTRSQSTAPPDAADAPASAAALQ